MDWLFSAEVGRTEKKKCLSDWRTTDNSNSTPKAGLPLKNSELCAPNCAIGELFIRQECFKAVRAGGMAQLAQRFGLNLANSFPSHVKFKTHLFQRMFGSIFQAEPHSDHVLLAWVECAQKLGSLIFHVHSDHGVRGGKSLRVPQ